MQTFSFVDSARKVPAVLRDDALCTSCFSMPKH